MTRSIDGLAEADLTEAFRFYRREAGRGVGSRFLSEFERVAALLEANPRMVTPTDAGRRMYPLVGFPYSVIYRENAGEIRILVVRHQSRDPDHRQNRN